MKYLLALIMLSLSVSAYGQVDTTDGVDGEFEPDPRNVEDVAPDNTQNGDLNSNSQNSNNNNRSTVNYGAGAGAPTPVSTAVAPSLLSSGSDSCLQSKSGGIQLVEIGYSHGAYKQDEECNRRRDSKVLKDLGMTVAAVSRMCQHDDNWRAMFSSGTPCPILVRGRMVFGKNAVLAMKTNPNVYIPDYSKNQNFYDTLLGIGVSNETNEENTDRRSVSERFRPNFSESME